MARAADRAGWTITSDGTIAFRNRIGSRARARAEALALGHSPSPFSGTGGGSGLRFSSTCGRCGANMVEDPIAGLLRPGDMLDRRCR